jgi:hypothetical protein
MATINCPYISFANIAVRGDGFALYSVKWAEVPLNKQLVLVQYRVFGDVTWINVSTNLNVDVFGNIANSVLVILETAVNGETYEVRLVNQCGSLEYIQKFVNNSIVYSNSYLLDNALYNICGNDPVTLFSSAPFAEGIIMYEDYGLTVPVTGFSYIDYNGNRIFSLDSGTGEVGADTTYTCSPFVFSALLANSTGAVCGATPVNVYSNKVSPTIGDFLFTDAPLSISLTGYTFLVFSGSLLKYNIDTSTGEILSLVGTSCTGYFAYYQVSKVKENIANETPVLLYSSTAFGKGAEMKTDSALSTAVMGSNFIKPVNSPIIHDIATATGVVGCTAYAC